MNRVIEYIKEHRKIFVIIVLLILFVLLGVILYGSQPKITDTSVTYASSETELKLMRILSEIEGVGKAEVMITETDGGVSGVIIVCEGADNIMTRNDVLKAVTTAFKIEKSNIAIYAMNK